MPDGNGVARILWCGLFRGRRGESGRSWVGMRGEPTAVMLEQTERGALGVPKWMRGARPGKPARQTAGASSRTPHVAPGTVRGMGTGSQVCLPGTMYRAPTKAKARGEPADVVARRIRREIPRLRPAPADTAGKTRARDFARNDSDGYVPRALAIAGACRRKSRRRCRLLRARPRGRAFHILAGVGDRRRR